MGAKSCQFQEGCQGYDMGLCDDSDACPHANEDGFKRFTVAAQANMVIADIGRGLGKYRYLFSPDEARKLATELINCAGKANLLEGKQIGEETKVDRVNDLFTDAARMSFPKKMADADQLRKELNLMDAVKHLGESLGQRMEKEWEAMGMVPWTSGDEAAPSAWVAEEGYSGVVDKPTKIAAAGETVSVDIECPSEDKPKSIVIEIDGKTLEETVMKGILVADDPANSELEVKGGKAVEDWWAGVLVGRKGTISGRIDCSKPNEANFKPGPQCICFGPPMDDCPVHGKK